MSILKLTNILDLVAGMSVAPELIGQDRIERFHKSTTAFLARLREIRPARLIPSLIITTAAKLLPGAWRDESTAHSVIRIALMATIIVGAIIALDLIYDSDVLQQLPQGVEKFTVTLLLFAVLLILPGLLLLLLGLAADGLLAFLLAISKRGDLSRALFVAGFIVFFASGLLKIFFT